MPHWETYWCIIGAIFGVFQVADFGALLFFSYRSKVKAVKLLKQVTVFYPNLYYHWELGYKLV